MSLQRAGAPMRAVIRSLSSLSLTTRPTASLPQHARCNLSPSLITVRHATHGAQGRANGPKNGAGKRLGAKKTGDEYVIPGNIIFRQRGTKWYPGENVGMGRDHTIFALETGFVKYYRDPDKHPKRKYIGIVFKRNESLPYPANRPRRRRLGMTLHDRPVSSYPAPPEQDAGNEIGMIPNPTDPEGKTVSVTQAAVGSDAKRLTPRELREQKRLKASGRLPVDQLGMRPDYSYRESNYDIGKAAQRAEVPRPTFKPGNRFLAWRKRAVRKKRNAEKRSMIKKQKMAKGKGKKKLRT